MTVSNDTKKRAKRAKTSNVEVLVEQDNPMATLQFNSFENNGIANVIPAPQKSVQLDLFSQFVTNDKDQVSNTIDLWELIPKYFLSAEQVKKLRTDDGRLAKSYEMIYEQDGKLFTVTIQPAQIKEDGEFIAYFPGPTEELIEEVLKKILADEAHAIHLPKKSETWVKFTIRMIHRELKAIGRTRNLDEIKRAITVMNKCNISVRDVETNREMWSGSILPELFTVNRKEWLSDREAMHAAKLSVFISESINKLNYRQINFKRLMSFDGQLSRWIYRRLINRFTNASSVNSYHFKYSTLKSSGLLQQGKEHHNRQKVIEALDELVAQDVLKHYTVDPRTEGRKVIEVVYTLYASGEFIKEQKAANKRNTDNRLIGQKQGLLANM